MELDPRAVVVREGLGGKLVAAVASPMDASGRVDVEAAERYFSGLVTDGVDALAVCAHTGRGPFLSTADRHQVITTARSLGVPVVVGVSAEASAGGSERQDLAVALAAAEQAAELGADALLVFPDPRAPVERHDAIWRAAGVPLLAFDLYLMPYPAPVLAELLAHPGVAGVKVARLGDALGCQASLAAARSAGRLAMTGEDRMFGPSLMWGAEAALVGIAAAAAPLTAAASRAWFEQRFTDFVAASDRVDRLAEVTFSEPFDGYVQRMLWIAAAEGRIPGELAVDRYRPVLGCDERNRVLDRFAELAGILRAGRETPVDSHAARKLRSGP